MIPHAYFSTTLVTSACKALKKKLFLRWNPRFKYTSDSICHENNKQKTPKRKIVLMQCLEKLNYNVHYFFFCLIDVVI